MKQKNSFKYSLLLATVAAGLVACTPEDGLFSPVPPVHELPPLPEFKTLEVPDEPKPAYDEFLPLSALPPVPDVELEIDKNLNSPEPKSEVVALNGAKKEPAPAAEKLLVQAAPDDSAEKTLEQSVAEALAEEKPAQNAATEHEAQAFEPAPVPEGKLIDMPALARGTATGLAGQEGAHTATGNLTPSQQPAMPKIGPQGGEIIDISGYDEEESTLAPTVAAWEMKPIEGGVQAEEGAPTPETQAEPSRLNLPIKTAISMPFNVVPPEQRVPVQPEKVADFTQLRARDSLAAGGVLVAESAPVPNSNQAPVIGKAADCAGTGLGVRVGSSTGDKNYLLDQDGKPCDVAEEMFNGNNPFQTRAPVQSVDIKFIKPNEPRPEKEEPWQIHVAKTEHKSGQGAAGEMPAAPTLEEIQWFDEQVNAQEPSPAASEGKLAGTIKAWQKEREEQTQETVRQADGALAADLRDIQRFAAGELAAEYQQQVEELAKRLREAEVQKELQQKRHEQVRARLENDQAKNSAQTEAWRTEERDLRQNMDSLSLKIVEMENLNGRLKESYTAREKEYMEKISKLTQDLKRAEELASKARQEMVLEAAKKIAEAERLAFAARMAKKEQMEREAARLKLEGSTLMQRAQDIEANRVVMVPNLSGELQESFPPVEPLNVLAQAEAEPDDFALPPIGSVPVVLHVKDMPLQQVFETVFKNLEPVMGAWRVTWEISGTNKGILEEEWTVAAETTFEDFLDYVQAQVKKIHGVDLKFNRFDQNRLFVVAD